MDDFMIESGKVQDESGSSFVQKATEVLKDQKDTKDSVKWLETGQIYCKYI